MSNPDIPDYGFLPQEDVNFSGDSPDHTKGDGATAKTKRMACLICRKRKLRCDGVRPSCGSCSRLGHTCGYSDIRRKSGPRRGYVKELEARLHRVESQLKTKDNASKRSAVNQNNVDRFGRDIDLPIDLDDDLDLAESLPDVANSGTSSNTPNDRAVIGLGLEEALPPRAMIEDLDRIYFDIIHTSIPMIHKYRYLAALNNPPICRPPVCLRYAMWTLVASIDTEYSDYTNIFYRRARKYIELDEMKGHGESFVTVGHAQCWALIASYEFRTMCFPRAWMSVGRTSRLVQMLGLQRVDHEGLEVKRTLAPAKDWVDKEERRRTFWIAYCNDRYASIGTGWPMTIDEKDIFTHLPSSLEAFEKGQYQASISFTDALTQEGASKLSVLGAITVVASIFGQIITHLHRSHDDNDPDDPINGGLWKRHRQLDKLLSSITEYLPDHLKLPAGDQDPNIPFLNVALHAAVICLHQAAILKAETHQLETALIEESVNRCFHAAEEIHDITKMTSLPMSRLHPFVAFCLYIAARVLIHTYVKRRDAVDVREKFEFLLGAMQTHMEKTPITASFLMQLQLELEAAGIEDPLAKVPMKHPEHMIDEEFVPPVVSRLSATQPTINGIRAASTSNPSIRGYPGSGPAAAVFDLPPRLGGKPFPMNQDPQPMGSGVETYAVYNNSDNITQQRQRKRQPFIVSHATPTSTYLNPSPTPTSYPPQQTRSANNNPLNQRPAIIPPSSTTSINIQPYFTHHHHPTYQPFPASVDTWDGVDLTLTPSMNGTAWPIAYDDGMAWDPATQGIGIQTMQDLTAEPWRTNAGDMNGNCSSGVNGRRG